MFCYYMVVAKVNFQVEPNHYYKNYDTKQRFCSYYHQIQEITKLNPKSLLEVGIGNSFVSDYIQRRGFNVTKLDIDKRLNPHVTGSVLNVPFPDKSFEVVACYEVLEHLPYANFEKALQEIERVSSSYVLISLPDSNGFYRVCLQIPKLGLFQKIIPFSTLRKSILQTNGEHYWEIGKAGCSNQKIINDIVTAGFKVERTYRVFEMPSHRFFVLKKMSKAKKTFKS